MNTPEEIAERSIAVYSTSLMGLVPSIQCLRETIAAAITARDAEWRAKFAAFCDETGEPRKVDGVLPINAEGAIVGGRDEDAPPMYSVHPADGEILPTRGSPRWSDLDDWRMFVGEPDADGLCGIQPLSWCYSTREAAIAAQETRK